MSNQLISVYSGVLSSIIICYIISRLNKNLKRPSVRNILVTFLFIAVCSSQISLLFTGRNVLLRVGITLVTLTLVISALLKFNLYYSLLTTALTVSLWELGMNIVNLIFGYLGAYIKEPATNVLYITIRYIIMFIFACIVVNIVADSFIRAREKIYKRYKKLTIILSMNLIATVALILFACYMFNYYLMYRKMNNYTDWGFVSVFFVIVLIILMILGSLYLINYLTVQMIKYERLRKIHVMDMMTDTFNRASGIKYLKEQLTICKRSNNELTICFIDINNLKVINDTLGHKQGDKLIKTVVEALRENIRDTDIISRLGGDEFIIIFPKCNKEHGERILRKVKKQLSTISLYKELDFAISFSYGFSVYDGSTNVTADELLDYADKQMYLNKKEIKAMAN